jgi:hypothetical protein
MENVENLTTLSKSGISSSQETLNSETPENGGFTELAPISEVEQRKRKHDSGENVFEAIESESSEQFRSQFQSAFHQSRISLSQSNVAENSGTFSQKMMKLTEASELIQEHAQQMDNFERERNRQKVLEKRRLQEELLKNSSLKHPMVQVGAAQDLDVNGKYTTDTHKIVTTCRCSHKKKMC